MVSASYGRYPPRPRKRRICVRPIIAPAFLCHQRQRPSSALWRLHEYLLPNELIFFFFFMLQRSSSTVDRSRSSTPTKASSSNPTTISNTNMKSMEVASSSSFHQNDGNANADATPPPTLRHPQQQKRALILQALGSIVLFLLGWYGPKQWIQRSATIGPNLTHRKPPYQVTQAGDVILDGEFNHPLVDPPTIPSGFLVFTGLQLPLILLAVASWVTTRPSNTTSLSWRTAHELHASLCGFLSTIGLSEGATQLLKLYMQRRRPNFYALCAFDVASKQCTAPPQKIWEAQFSFPSGHSSLSNAAMTYLVWYFLGKWVMAMANSSTTATTTTTQSTASSLLQSNDNNNNSILLALSSPGRRLQGLLICCVPWGWAIFVGASRVADTWHHPSDVVAGLCLGFAVATVMYHAWFPSLGTMAGTPWSWHAATGGSLYSYEMLTSTNGGSTNSNLKLPSFHE